MITPVTILCAADNSFYKKIPFLNVYDKQRNAWSYKGDDMIIAHPPCQQWGRLRGLANKNEKEKELALFCLDQVMKNGGILEHPVSSLLWNHIERSKVTLLKVNQSWWGYPATKSTILLFRHVRPLSFPLNFNAITHRVSYNKRNPNRLKTLYGEARSETTLYFCSWLVECIRQSKTEPDRARQSQTDQKTSKATDTAPARS